MGLLSALMDRQETYKGILRQLRQTPDASFAETITAAHGMDESTIVAVATVLYEIEEQEDPDRMPRENDLLWAVEFIDHLDTLGKEIVSKP